LFISFWFAGVSLLGDIQGGHSFGLHILTPVTLEDNSLSASYDEVECSSIYLDNTH
jgi:hypothetical protein